MRGHKQYAVLRRSALSIAGVAGQLRSVVSTTKIAQRMPMSRIPVTIGSTTRGWSDKQLCLIKYFGQEAIFYVVPCEEFLRGLFPVEAKYLGCESTNLLLEHWNTKVTLCEINVGARPCFDQIS